MWFVRIKSIHNIKRSQEREETMEREIRWKVCQTPFWGNSDLGTIPSREEMGRGTAIIGPSCHGGQHLCMGTPAAAQGWTSQRHSPIARHSAVGVPRHLRGTRHSRRHATQTPRGMDASEISANGRQVPVLTCRSLSFSPHRPHSSSS